MLAGGAEACVDAATIAGFARARALADPEAMFPGSTTRAEKGPPKTGSANDGEGSYRDADALASRSCRPFDADRGGFVIGEGAGVLVLETLEGAVERGAAVYGEIRGFGQAGDAHHVTLPPADGAGAAAAMRDALRDAGLEAEDVGYVNAHATGTRAGDAAEAEALRRVFGARFFARGRGEEEGGRGRDGEGRAAFDADSDRLLTSSTKGATGHALGAAGAVEAAFAALAVAEGVVPPTLNLARVDPGMVAAAEAEGGGGGGGGARISCRRGEARAGAARGDDEQFRVRGTNASLVVAAPPPGVGAKRIGRGGEGKGERDETRGGGAEECVVYVLKVCQHYHIEGDFVFLGPRETRKPRRGAGATERGRRARARAARARLAPAPRRALTSRRRARDAPSVFRLPSSSSRALHDADARLPRGAHSLANALGFDGRSASRARAARRRDATRAGVTNVARPCAVGRVRALVRVERGAMRVDARTRALA